MLVTVEPLVNEGAYENALREVSRLIDQNPGEGTDELARLDVLATLVHAYEKRHYPIAPLDPVAAIQFRMDQTGMTPRDLEPFIGQSGRVSEILNKQRPLTIAMMRRLSVSLGIPLGILAQDYPTTYQARDTPRVATLKTRGSSPERPKGPGETGQEKKARAALSV